MFMPALAIVVAVALMCLSDVSAVELERKHRHQQQALDAGAHGHVRARARTNIVGDGIVVTFKHSNTVPPSGPVSSGQTSTLYESTVTVSSPDFDTVSFSGSIWPDDMSVKGHLKDGSYSLNLGFHKRKGNTVTGADLVAKTGSSLLRPALIVNGDGTCSVESDNAAKTVSHFIHVHNGFNTKRYSDGCPTLRPDNWVDFIQHFLDLYPELDDWGGGGTSYIGKKIGTLVIEGPSDTGGTGGTEEDVDVVDVGESGVESPSDTGNTKQEIVKVDESGSSSVGGVASLPKAKGTTKRRGKGRRRSRV